MKLHYEVTDLFGGEANYCWVKRGVISNPKKTDRGNITYVKRLLGYTGVKHTTESYGDMIRVDFTRGGLLHVMFLTWEDA